MSKIIVVDPERCTGCRLCEVVCSVVRTGDLDASRSCIRILNWDEAGVHLPVLCRHCEDPLCAAVCPVNAIRRDASGAVLVDRERCVDCFSCVSACPNGALRVDPLEHTVLRCDLCGGDPSCVHYCQEKALQHMESDECQVARKRSSARNLYGK